MTSLLLENRLRLQQRISQRLRGDWNQISTNRDIIPQRFIPRRRRRQDDQTQTDPFRLQAQEYLYHDVSLGERLLQQQASYGAGDNVRLPIFKPRYTDMHPHKGVPTQKYVDVILDRKGPMHRVPSKYVRGSVSLHDKKQYDDSMMIRSYRHIDEYPSRLATPDESQPYGRIMLIAPQRIQYPVQGSNRLYTLDKGTSTSQLPTEKSELAALKGKRLKTITTIDEKTDFIDNASKRSLPFLRKVRKTMNSVDRKFVDGITSKVHMNDPNSNPSFMRGRDREKTVLPPIRITVTNPLPNESSSSPEVTNENNSKTAQNIPLMKADAPKKLPFVKLANQPKEKKKQKKKAKNHSKFDRKYDNHDQDEQKLENTVPDTEEEPADGVDLSRRESDNGLLMPAPITKITFQSYNGANLKKPKKAPTNVQVERVIQGDVIATHPRAFRRDNVPAVRVSNFEMEDNAHPDMVIRKDGTMGPAPPSTNYVNFQKTTRLGGQSRVLLGLRNRQLAVDAEDILRNWSRNDNILAIHSNNGELSDYQRSHGHSDGVIKRKLGRIRAMKRSMLAAHNALIAAKLNGKIEIDAVTDEGKSERSFDSDQLPYNAKKARPYYVNRMKEPSVSNNPAQSPITGFYMGRPNESYEAQLNARTRTMGTQWTVDEMIPTANLPTPQAPPNTAFYGKKRRQFKH